MKIASIRLDPVPNLVRWTTVRFILKGCQRLAGGRQTAHYRNLNVNQRLKPLRGESRLLWNRAQGCVPSHQLADVISDEAWGLLDSSNPIACFGLPIPADDVCIAAELVRDLRLC